MQETDGYDTDTFLESLDFEDILHSMDKFVQENETETTCDFLDDWSIDFDNILEGEKKKDEKSPNLVEMQRKSFREISTQTPSSWESNPKYRRGKYNKIKKSSYTFVKQVNSQDRHLQKLGLL